MQGYAERYHAGVYHAEVYDAPQTMQSHADLYHAGVYYAEFSHTGVHYLTVPPPLVACASASAAGAGGNGGNGGNGTGSVFSEQRERENACEVSDADTYLGEINKQNLAESIRLTMRSLDKAMHVQNRAATRRRTKVLGKVEPRVHALLERVSMLNNTARTAAEA